MQQVTILDKTFEVMISRKQIENRVKEIASQLNGEYKDKNPVFIGVLNGAFLFMADLFRNIETPCEVSFIRVSSYSGTSSTGTMKQVIGLSANLKNRHIILIEDIVDTGETVTFLMKELAQHQPASVKLVTLLFKPAALKKPVTVDYSGFEIEPEFVVGYGLDYDGYGRNLQDIYVLKKS
ncbi:MAG: hypoxanthine phosphoribosyltransferase [Bacteroidetes bacterium]|jgi:hypoxanthine phosphoribosyltransferase|nr:hypoxanthine phosphoribosyltransferase [Bacteroidota bacterium]